MAVVKEKYLWVEKFRPATIGECILPAKMKADFQIQVENREIQHMLFHGIQGSGKTTCAFAIASQLDADALIINGSNERGIDLFRVKLMQFVSSVSLMGKMKIVIIEEADNLTIDAQKMARKVLEDFSDNCKFIFTCNYPNKIIPALHSRMASYSFNTTSEEKNKLGALFFARVKMILTENKIEYNEKILVQFILKLFPDYRKILNELQKYSLGGVIDAGIFSSTSITHKEYIDAVLKKDFKEARRYIGENCLDSDFYSTIYKQVLINEEFPKESIPSLILILADYQYKDAFAVDREVNLAAMSIEMMTAI